MQQTIHRPKTGWSNEEERLLFDVAASARQKGKPLKTVFAEVASLTCRKPNSVRNFYYQRIKTVGENLPMHCAAFVPFSEEESKTLLKAVLTAQANGMSVRAVCLQLGNGETKSMLRFQNKYRSIIRTNPNLVTQTVNELKEAGIHVKTPDTQPQFMNKPKKTMLTSLASTLIYELENKGIDSKALISSLIALATPKNNETLV